MWRHVAVNRQHPVSPSGFDEIADQLLRAASLFDLQKSRVYPGIFCVLRKTWHKNKSSRICRPYFWICQPFPLDFGEWYVAALPNNSIPLSRACSSKPVTLVMSHWRCLRVCFCYIWECCNERIVRVVQIAVRIFICYSAYYIKHVDIELLRWDL